MRLNRSRSASRDASLVRDIDARFAAGEFVAVLGPNGVGKTTLLRAICGIRPTIAGRIELDGTPLRALSPSERARAIAFVTSDDAMIETLRVRDVVAIGRFPHHPWWEWSASALDDVAIDRALLAVSMQHEQHRLLSTLSSGERQRVWIAMGLAQETPVLCSTNRRAISTCASRTKFSRCYVGSHAKAARSSACSTISTTPRPMPID